jgi:dUTP pyrophosphatase
MNSINFKKLHPNAQTPKLATEGSAAVDLVATSKETTYLYIEYGTGIAVQIPPGHVGVLAARSSVSNMELILSNGIGLIDSDYTGEIKLRFKYVDQDGAVYEVGDRVGQLMIVPIITPVFVELDELTDTKRGSNGFGSTGR